MRKYLRHTRQSLLKRVLTLGGVLLSLVLSGLVLIQKDGRAADLSKFNPGNIMSDAVMSNKDTMTVQEIQNFLNSKNPCNNTKTYLAAQYPHLHYNIRDGRFVCMAQESFDGESAAQIIWQAAQDYQINPQVLIVLLQKEQGLVTDTWPNHIQYRSATGYGCPDTAACDTKYYGFKNQVRNAAALFRTVLNGGWSNYPVGNTYVQWSPNAACGGSTVNIQNRATSALYRYTPYQPNQAALNAGYGSGDSCSAYGNRNFFAYFTDWFGSTWHTQGLISYQSSALKYGWQAPRINSGVTGTTGQSRPLEALRIDGEVRYSVYIEDQGWQPAVNSHMIAGTTGYNRPIQAVKVEPTGSLAAHYGIWYRVHVSNIGWLDWTKNGNPAGAAGSSASHTIEAIEFAIRAKNTTVNLPTTRPFVANNSQNASSTLGLTTSSHIGNVGWQPAVLGDMTSGTVGAGRRIEAIKFKLDDTAQAQGDIVYAAHISHIGWQAPKKNGEVAGTTGQSRQMEAVRLTLTGQLAKDYDIWYRAHVGNIGWLGWAKNGAPAGSVGIKHQLEAVEVRIEKKDSSFSNTTGSPLYNPTKQPIPSGDTNLTTSAHVSNIGWMNRVGNNSIAGTTGRALGLEALKIDVSQYIFNQPHDDIKIICSASNDSGKTWITTSNNNELCGTTGQSKPLKVIKLGLAGEDAHKYNLRYSIHAAYIGWMPYVNTGTEASSPHKNFNIEAIKVNLTKK